MSARVRAARQRPARGGDGRRRAWSESKIPRPGARRVRGGVSGAAGPIHEWDFAGWESETADFLIPDTGAWGDPDHPEYLNNQALSVQFSGIYDATPDSIIFKSGTRISNAGGNYPSVFTLWIKVENIGGWFSSRKMAFVLFDPITYDRGLTISCTNTGPLRFYYRYDNFYGFPSTGHFYEHAYSREALEIRWVTDRDNGTAVLEINGTVVYSGSPSPFWGTGGDDPADCTVMMDAWNGKAYGIAADEVFSVRAYDGNIPRSAIA